MRYKKNYFGSALDSFSNALKWAREERYQIRMLLNLGHTHRLHGVKADAIPYYKRVLEIDPHQRVAKRYLSQLETYLAVAD